jgi:hypothetical protein
LENDAYPDTYPGFKEKIAPQKRVSKKAMPHKTDSNGPQNDDEKPSNAPQVGVGPPNTHTQPHTTTAKTVLGVDENPSAMAEREAGALLAEFVRQNDGQPGGCTTKHKKALLQLAATHGRQTFRAAAKAWFKRSPWRSDTKYPFAELISGFESYVAMSKHKPKEPLTPEVIAATNAWAASLRAEMFDLPKPSESEPDANAFLEEGVAADKGNEENPK